MKILLALVKRNTRLIFKDKALFLTSLIMPVMLFVLYVSFIGNIYTDSLKLALPEGVILSDRLLAGFKGGELIASVLSVSAVTVAFTANMLMVQDKANGAILDFSISPVKPQIMAVGYYLSTLAYTLIICLTTAVLCLSYVGVAGWYLSVADVLLLVLDVILLCFFGVAVSSVVNFFLKSQGQISAVGSTVSSTYGFISGAYMPLSQFPAGFRAVLGFLPGTYGTSLLRGHSLRGVLEALKEEGLSEEFVLGVRDNFDLNLYFFGERVGVFGMYAIVLGAAVISLGLYVLLNVLKIKKAGKENV